MLTICCIRFSADEKEKFPFMTKCLVEKVSCSPKNRPSHETLQKEMRYQQILVQQNCSFQQVQMLSPKCKARLLGGDAQDSNRYTRGANCTRRTVSTVIESFKFKKEETASAKTTAASQRSSGNLWLAGRYLASGKNFLRLIIQSDFASKLSRGWQPTRKYSQCLFN